VIPRWFLLRPKSVEHTRPGTTGKQAFYNQIDLDQPKGAGSRPSTSEKPAEGTKRIKMQREHAATEHQAPPSSEHRERSAPAANNWTRSHGRKRSSHHDTPGWRQAVHRAHLPARLQLGHQAVPHALERHHPRRERPQHQGTFSRLSRIHRRRGKHGRPDTLAPHRRTATAHDAHPHHAGITRQTQGKR
jgi:hypothetical protein